MHDSEPSPPQSNTPTETTCCIVGSGPAGAILALLLARKGVAVTLLEEHMDFERDFRGDTIHSSVLEILDEIGLADRMLQLDHTRASGFPVQTDKGIITLVNFAHLRTKYPFIAILPQARFLEFITNEARRYPSFRLLMGARAEKLIEEDGYVHGVVYRAKDGMHELRATLTVGADGRFSRMRKLAGFDSIKTSPPMDVLWFYLPRAEGDPRHSIARIGSGHFLVLLDRGDLWQVGFVIAKGGYQLIRAEGLDKLRQNLARALPQFAARMDYLQEWKQVSVLSVESSRVKRWYRPGLLLIGDAAHVMTPVGGVGINYAIQDAVATANILIPDLQQGKAPTSALARVQRKRELPTRLIQRFQNFIQRTALTQILSTDQPLSVSPMVMLMTRIPVIRDIPGRFIAFGLNPEHVRV